MAESKAKIPEDDFVSKVVKDPKQPPDTLLLNGFLGKSSEEGHTRLYFDPELKSYVEIPQEAIQHWQEISKEVSPLGGYHVWINPSAELIHGKVGPQRTKAKFFEGPIGAAAAGVGAGGGVAQMHGGAFGISHLPIQCGGTLQPGCSTQYHLQCIPSPLPVACGNTMPGHCGPVIPHSHPLIACGVEGGGLGPDPRVQGFQVQAQARTAVACHPTTIPACQQHTVQHLACPPTTHNCLTPNIACATMFQHCPSFGCPVSIHCVSVGCTLSGNQCNISGFGCPSFGCTLTIECQR